jgi:hypothetical protein
VAAKRPGHLAVEGLAVRANKTPRHACTL